MSAPATTLRAEITALIHDEYPAASVYQGRPHEALQPGAMTFFVFPSEEAEDANVYIERAEVILFVFLPWTKEIDVNRVVDTTELEAVIEALRVRTKTYRTPYAGSTEVWNFRLVHVDYRQDPTGDITRATVTFQSYGQNLSETT